MAFYTNKTKLSSGDGEPKQKIVFRIEIEEMCISEWKARNNIIVYCILYKRILLRRGLSVAAELNARSGLSWSSIRCISLSELGKVWSPSGHQTIR